MPETVDRYVQELATALAAVRAAEEILESRPRDLEVRAKADASPVTEFDTRAETMIRSIVSAAFPSDGILGEEYGHSRGPSGRTWIIDPLDGTKSIVRNLPFYSTQIALHDGGRLVVGVSNAPAFAECAFGTRAGGAWIGEERLLVSPIRELAAATVSFGNLKTLARKDRLSSCSELVLRTNRTRGYGDFYHYHALARGRLDIVVESDVSIYDVAALAVIVEEAGGRVSTLDGSPLAFDSTTIVATNGWLHDEVLSILAAR